jgi:hypothetical protein
MHRQSRRQLGSPCTHQVAARFPACGRGTQLLSRCGRIIVILKRHQRPWPARALERLLSRTGTRAAARVTHVLRLEQAATHLVWVWYTRPAHGHRCLKPCWLPRMPVLPCVRLLAAALPSEDARQVGEHASLAGRPSPRQHRGLHLPASPAVRPQGPRAHAGHGAPQRHVRGAMQRWLHAERRAPVVALRTPRPAPCGRLRGRVQLCQAVPHQRRLCA